MEGAKGRNETHGRLAGLANLVPTSNLLTLPARTKNPDSIVLDWTREVCSHQRRREGASLRSATPMPQPPQKARYKHSYIYIYIYLTLAALSHEVLHSLTAQKLHAVVLHGRLMALAPSARFFALALADTQFHSVPLLPRPKKQHTPRSLRC